MPKTEERDPRRRPTPEAGPSQRARSQGAAPRNPTGDLRAFRTETSPGTVPKLTGPLFHKPVVPTSGAPEGAATNGCDSTGGPLLDTPNRARAEQQFRDLSKEEAALASVQQELKQAFHSALSTPQQDMRHWTPSFQVAVRVSWHMGQSFEWKSLTGGRIGAAAAIVGRIVGAGNRGTHQARRTIATQKSSCTASNFTQSASRYFPTTRSRTPS